MLNKKTILFFTDDTNADMVNNVVKELPTDGSVVNLVIRRKELQNELFNKIYDKILPEENNLRRKINDLLLEKNAKNNTKRIPQKIAYSSHNSMQKRIYNSLVRYNPTLVVVDTHLLLPDVIAALDKYGHRARLAVICDEFVLDKRLIHRRVDYYFVDNFGMRNDLSDGGVNGERIIISGYPVDKKAFDVMDREQALKKFALENSPVILVSASVAGDERFIKVVKSLDDADLDANIVVACGKSAEFINSVRDMGLYAYNDGIDMNAALDACSALVCRPTTMLLAEAIAKKKKIFTLLPLGKAEEDNMKYLSHDLVTVATDSDDLVKKVKLFLETKTVAETPATEEEKDDNMDKEDYLETFDSLGAKRIASKLITLA